MNFWPRVDQGPDCWLWTGYKTAQGYGQIGIKRVLRYAHRVSWELAYGQIPDGLCVLHRCDNPPCVRPDHLFLGTRADNTADMLAKDRHRTVPLRGDQNGNAKLTASQVALIRALYAVGGISQRQLARQFGVVQGTIVHVLAGRTWRATI